MRKASLVLVGYHLKHRNAAVTSRGQLGTVGGTVGTGADCPSRLR